MGIKFRFHELVDPPGELDAVKAMLAARPSVQLGEVPCIHHEVILWRLYQAMRHRITALARH